MVAAGSAPPFELVVGSDEAGQRLDRVLARRGLGLSRSHLARWIDAGCVTVNGSPVERSSRVKEGDVVFVQPAQEPPSDAVAQEIPIAILFEDDAVVVVEKAAGMVVHPAAGNPDGTLVNAILFHLYGPDTTGPMLSEGGLAAERARPGIVHRLDKDTSGVMVIAKTMRAKDELVRRFQAHDIDRVYKALVYGAPPAALTFDTLHGRHRVDRKRFTSRVENGKRAVTHMKVVEKLEGAAFVECRLETGRTHQIRMHLSEHGYPVVGDKTYGRAPKDTDLRSVSELLGRQALHAAVLGFAHPYDGRPLRFESELPEDMRGALITLRERGAVS